MNQDRLCDLLAQDMNQNDMTGSLPVAEMTEAREKRLALKLILQRLIRATDDEVLSQLTWNVNACMHYGLNEV